jgi:hypothetical protein
MRVRHRRGGVPGQAWAAWRLQPWPVGLGKDDKTVWRRAWDVPTNHG